MRRWAEIRGNYAEILHTPTPAIPPFSREIAPKQTFFIILLMSLQHSTQHETFTMRCMSRALSCFPEKLYKRTHTQTLLSNESSFHPDKHTDVNLYVFNEGTHTTRTYSTLALVVYLLYTWIGILKFKSTEGKTFFVLLFTSKKSTALLTGEKVLLFLFQPLDGTLMKNSYSYLSLPHSSPSPYLSLWKCGGRFEWWPQLMCV